MKRKSKTKPAKPATISKSELKRVAELRGLDDAEFERQLRALVEQHAKHIEAEIKTIGRPLRAGEKTTTITLRATPAEIEAWRSKATAGGWSLVAWAREHLNAKAGV